MLALKKPHLFILTISLATTFQVFGESVADLLDRIVREPGRWSQMCASPPPIPFEVPFPLYSMAAPRYFSLSEQNLQQLQQRRSEVVPEIVRRLGKIDFSKAPKRKARRFSSTVSNQDPNDLSGLMLEIILNLDAVETLPELLRLESDLNARIQAAEKNGGDSLPVLDADSPVFMVSVHPDTDSTPQEYRMFVSRIFQRELLSVMTALLREKRFQPLLDSDLEKTYFEYLKKEAGSNELKGIKKPEDVPPDSKRWISFDPIHNLPVTRHGPQFTPYTPELRLKIRGLVTDFLNLAPNGRASAPPATK